MQTDWTVFVGDDGVEVPRTWSSVRDGLVPWSDLDGEELSRGKLRDRIGGFRGTRGLCPPDLQRAMVQEHVRRATEELRAGMDSALATIRNVADGSVFGATASDQLKAATYILERTMGKIPDKIEMTATIKPWEQLVEAIIVDAEVVEDERPAISEDDGPRGLTA